MMQCWRYVCHVSWYCVHCPHCQESAYFSIKKYNLKVVKGKVVKRTR